MVAQIAYPNNIVRVTVSPCQGGVEILIINAKGNNLALNLQSDTRAN